MDKSKIKKSSKEKEPNYKFLYEIINDDWLANIDFTEKPQYIKLPKTSIKHYISRTVALNIHTSNFGGDWHFFDTFFWPGYENDYEKIKDKLNFLCGEGEECNTNSILGKKGILERSELVKSQGLTFEGSKVYVATYARAIADMVLFFTKQGIPRNITLDEWTPRQKEQKIILEYLNIALKSDKIDAAQKARIKEWIKTQKPIS